jgi:hypothetical protein
MEAQGLMTNTYFLPSSNASAVITLVSSDLNHRHWILKNTDLTNNVCVCSGETSPTAAFPASATVPVRCKVLGPGETTTYEKDRQHKYLAAIWSGTGSSPTGLFASVGLGK